MRTRPSDGSRAAAHANSVVTRGRQGRALWGARGSRTPSLSGLPIDPAGKSEMGSRRDLRANAVACDVSFQERQSGSIRPRSGALPTRRARMRTCCFGATEQSGCSKSYADQFGQVAPPRATARLTATPKKCRAAHGDHRRAVHLEACWVTATRSHAIQNRGAARLAA